MRLFDCQQGGRKGSRIRHKEELSCDGHKKGVSGSPWSQDDLSELSQVEAKLLCVLRTLLKQLSSATFLGRTQL